MAGRGEARWDSGEKFAQCAGVLYERFEDEKFITARQAIESVSVWAPFQPAFLERAADALQKIEISKRRESQQTLLRKDIAAALACIQQKLSGTENHCLGEAAQTKDYDKSEE